MDWAELIMRRKNVAEFVRADPVKISVIRQGDPIRTGGGGKLPGKTETLLPQTVRIVQNVRRYTAGIVNSEAGDIPNGVYVLIAKHSTNLKRDDRFIAGGEEYIVLGVSQLRKKEYTLASLDFYGLPNQAGRKP